MKKKRRGAAMVESRTKLGRFVRTARLKLGLTQGGLAEAAQVSQNLVSQIEIGTRKNLKSAQVMRFAKALQCDEAELRALLPAKPAPQKPASEPTALGKLIRSRREALSLTIESFAEMIGMPVDKALELERKHKLTIRYGVARPLAIALGLDPAVIAPFVGRERKPAEGELGKMIRSRRKELGLSPAALAEKAGVSRQMIDQIERGRCSLRDGKETLRNIARTLKLSVPLLEALRQPKKPGPASVKTPLGEFLVSKRRKLRLTQEKLSKRAHLSVAMISVVENGRGNPTTRSLERWARALNHCRIPNRLMFS